MSDGMKLRVVALALVSAGGVLIAACATEPAMSEAELIQEGGELANTMCGGCHAVGDEGASPNPAAPPLRAAYAGADQTQFAQQMREGLPAGHPDMPRFVFTPDQIDALTAYLGDLEE